MSGKKMEGNEQQRREAARQARREGKLASEVGGSQASSQQRTKAGRQNTTHQERIDMQREGKQDVIAQNTPEARPGSRDPDTPDRERHPRLDHSVEERGQRRTRGTT